MIVFKCDCNGCNNTDVKLNSLTIDTVDGSTATYDICNECLDKIRNIIDSANGGRKVITDVVKEVGKQECEKHSNKGKASISRIIEEYGIEKLKDEYTIKGRSTGDIAEELGVNKTSLAQYMARAGIHKRKAKDREESTACDSKEDN